MSRNKCLINLLPSYINRFAKTCSKGLLFLKYSCISVFERAVSDVAETQDNRRSMVWQAVTAKSYGKALLPKVIQFSKPLKNTTLHIEIFIQLVQFSIQGIQFHTFPIEISTKTRRR